MMSVKILAFGSNWWARFGSDPGDPVRYTRHAAYFNSTGVRCGRKIKRHWILPGLIRFNGFGDFNPHFPSRAIGTTFWCTNLVSAFGGNRVLFVRESAETTVPDCYLVVVSSDRFGVIDFGDPYWKSASTYPIAASQLRERQEVMLLMAKGECARSRLGTWCLMPCPNLCVGVALQLI
jgi:hypothetical protein